MESMQVRIDEKNMNALNELARTLSSSRSEVIRRVIEGGIRELRMKIAIIISRNNFLSLNFFGLPRLTPIVGMEPVDLYILWMCLNHLGVIPRYLAANS